MIFTTKEEVETSAARVMAVLSDVDAAERAALRRGIRVERVDSTAVFGEGLRWKADFTMRGKKRRMDLHLARLDPEGQMAFAGQTDSLAGTLVFDVLPLSVRRSRLSVTLEVKPRTLSARLLLQSLRLTKSSLTARYKSRIRALAREIELRAR